MISVMLTILFIWGVLGFIAMCFIVSFINEVVGEPNFYQMLLFMILGGPICWLLEFYFYLGTLGNKK